ncbi:hypothetical protein OIU77_019230 [Salix suchowensis]|uniref:Uncharacterized protein n=1 Tax=Salix suchowensis TaxID=1278906 RepID=A0ABQ9CFF5_9ROSI|nr:hypothetical protein OIU77_019230 [Salix suchowensis]
MEYVRSSLEERHRNLWMEYEARLEDPQYGLVDSEGDYESAAALVNGGLQPLYMHSACTKGSITTSTTTSILIFTLQVGLDPMNSVFPEWCRRPCFLCRHLI